MSLKIREHSFKDSLLEYHLINIKESILMHQVKWTLIRLKV